jgi:oligopeptide transport system ATP-binding protein
VHTAIAFIAHDPSIVRHISDRVGVMYLGRMAEIGTDTEIYEHPTPPVHPGAAVRGADARPRGAGAPWGSPVEGRGWIILSGEVPSPANPPSGCRFRTRCWKAQERCAQETPLLAVPEVYAGAGTPAAHESACHFAAEKDVVGAA